MANIKTFLGKFSKVEHCEQNDGDRARSAICMRLEKKERVSMREGEKGERRKKNALSKNVYTNTKSLIEESAGLYCIIFWRGTKGIKKGGDVNKIERGAGRWAYVGERQISLE